MASVSALRLAGRPVVATKAVNWLRNATTLARPAVTMFANAEVLSGVITADATAPAAGVAITVLSLATDSAIGVPPVPAQARAVASYRASLEQ